MASAHGCRRSVLSMKPASLAALMNFLAPLIEIPSPSATARWTDSLSRFAFA